MKTKAAPKTAALPKVRTMNLVTAVNEALSGAPELVNSDPYGGGWICEITTTASSDFDALLDAGAYQTLTNN